CVSIITPHCDVSSIRNTIMSPITNISTRSFRTTHDGHHLAADRRWRAGGRGVGAVAPAGQRARSLRARARRGRRDASPLSRADCGSARGAWDRHRAISVSLHGAAGQPTRSARSRGGDGAGGGGGSRPRRAGAAAGGGREVVRRTDDLDGAGGGGG